MAPEQAAGAEVDERADVYAAGMVLGETLLGKRPVERTPTPEAAQADEKDRTALMWQPERSARALVERHKLGGAPRPVAKLVEAAVSDDAAARPRDGSAWLAGLRSARLLVDRPRRARRVALLGGIGAVLGLAVAGFATWRIWERQIPGGRPTVAVADFVNETGDSELDSISGLLITSLEQGTQLRVLTRGRMLDVLKQLGKEGVKRIDEPLAREVGMQARVDALLLATIRRLGDTIVVEMRALDPLHDEYVFTVREQAATKAGVFGMVDRLGATARRRLAGESREPLPESRISAITTASPRAWDLYFQAVRARDESRLDDAARLAQEALVEDPGFALARFLALDATWTVWGNNQDAWLDPDTELETRKALEKVEAAADRLPEKERLSLRAMRASLEKQWAVAGEIRDRVSALYPLDKEAVFLAGDVRFHSEGFAEAIPYFRRALQLDPGFRLAAEHMEWSLTNIGRAAEEIDWLRAQVPLARSGEERQALFWAFLSAGQEADARRIQDEANARSGRTSVWPALALYWVHHGRAPEAETAMREAIAAKKAREAAAGKPHVPNWKLPYALGQSLAAQGRFREEALVPREQDFEGDPRYRALQLRQWAAAGRQDHAQLEALTRELANQGTFSGKDGGNWLEGPKSAVVTAMAGRLDLAAQTARAVLDGSAVRGLTAP
ncbi:MAG TPA: hypothetical protein VFM45_11520, partial [Anaeromyxobacteraceae bacterium]|nr:hypothetical protein [Anaeromyxobacteraceae bacterium]